MREEYAGREVAVGAVRSIFDVVARSEKGRSTLARMDLDAERFSWDEFCELLDIVARNVSDPRTIGAEGLASTVYKFRRRARLARLVLTLEDALRFILYPRNPIDFACMNTAVTGTAGRVDVVAYLFDRFQPNHTFFEIMLGAAEEFLRMLDLPGGKVTMNLSGRQAHYTFTYEAGTGVRDRIHRFVSAKLHGLYSILVIRSSYPDLVYGRKMFEEQLIERANVEAQLTSAERAFERRVAHIDDVISEWDSSGRLIYGSPNLRRLIGASAEEILADPRKAVHPDDLDGLREGLQQALADGNPRRIDDFRVLDAQGNTRWVEVSLTPFTGSGGDRRCLGVVRDVTERRKLFAERQNLDRYLEHTQRLELVGVLAGGIAHDFNNLLMPILGHAELMLLELDDPEKLRARIGTIREAADTAADLVKQLTVYAGSEPAEFVMVDLAQETDSLLGLIRASIPANVQVQTSLDDVAFVRGDASQLRQVIMNLVINAAEAIGEAAGTIKLSVTSGRGSVRLVVADDGCGMDEATRERAFEPFYTTKFAGRGLGLSAVMGIVSAHGAQLTVDTAPGRGTTIEMTLEAAGGGVVDVAIPEATAFKGSGCVLLVDDDAEVRNVGKSMLEGLGYDVEVASDGAQALELLERGEFVAMVLDLVMPRVDGREVLKTLRASQSQMPVVLVSGYGAQKFGLRLDVDPHTRFLSKPYRARELAAVLGELSAGRASRTA